MNGNVFAFLLATGAVTLAEMGDKTQLLAMAFACKYKASKVMIGVFIATIFNHAIAVAIGNYLTTFKSMDVWIQGVASVSFVLFGLWTIRGDKLEGEDKRKTRFGAVMTVTIAFFIAELGDKTQLATIALAAKYPANPLGILAGTTTGMLIADGIGIAVGVVMCKRIPERTIKLVSAGVFILFGLIGIYQLGVQKLSLGRPTTLMLVAAIALLTAAAAYVIIKKSNAQAENDTVAEYCAIRNQNPTPEGEG